MKLLNAILCYNRFHLLRNTVDSLLEFGPPGDILVVDDGSDDPRIVAYLESLRSMSITVVRREHKSDFHGGLYANMNLAVEHAIANGHSHIFFIQDDVQFMWRDEGFLARVENVFRACPDAAMVFPVFQKGIMSRTMPARMEPDAAGQCWHLKPYGLCDMGIMPLALFHEKNWRFGNSEGENGRVWREWGYKLYSLSAPVLAWVPWPEVRIYSERLHQEREPAEKYFLKPLSPAQIGALKAAGISRLPYHEEYCFPWNWGCLSPYWFTRGRKEYLKKLWSEKRMPKWVKAA